MKKRKIVPILVAGSLLVQSIFTGITNSNATTNEESLKVDYNSYDTNEIPDKYNTGTTGELTTIEMGALVNGVQMSAGDNSTVNVFDFFYRNTDLSGTITFENMDFSQYPVALRNADKVDREIHLIFKNCKFTKFAMPQATTSISCEFTNCTFNSCSGSNAEFNYCQFGQTYSDGLVPFQNVEVNNCLFYDFTSVIATGGELHIDGTQIYGKAGIDVTNVSYNGCRFEVPPIENKKSTAYVNACIMLQMEYSNADDVSFNDCIVNGGGYTIYARAINDYALTDITFDNIQFGCTSSYGYVYPDVSQGVTFSNISNTDSLYIGSVWKDEEGDMHLSVTNDTNQDRELTVIMGEVTYTKIIPACPTKAEFSDSTTYSSMPFDMDIEIPYDVDYYVCYDTTTEGFAKQIRFVNYGDEDVYLDESDAKSLFSNEAEIVTTGSCGKNVTYTLTSDGVLTLSGEGETYSYHSGKPAPWSDYKSQITEIRVEESVTTLGSQIFSGCNGAQSVSLPEGLTSIGSRAFAGCTCLLEVTLPNTISSIGDYAFNSALLNTVYFNGTEEAWSEVQVGNGNNSNVNNPIYLDDTTGSESTETTESTEEEVTTATSTTTEKETTTGASTTTEEVTTGASTTTEKEVTTATSTTTEEEVTTETPGTTNTTTTGAESSITEGKTSGADSSVNTGDRTNLMPILILLFISVAGLNFTQKLKEETEKR